jgi:hypothetical protein
MARQMKNYEYKKKENVIKSININLNENITNCLILKITGIIATQVDGHRIPNRQHFFKSIGCLVLRGRLVGNLFSRQSTLSR